MRFTAVALALTLAAAMVGSLHASEIYKWVDENGNVHYGDRPSGDPGEEVVPIASHPTNPGQVQARVEARHEREAAKAEALAALPEGPSKEELAAEAADRRQKCQMYKERLQTFIVKRHLYRELEDGERYYLTEEEMMQAQDDARAKIDEYCDD